MSTTDQTTRTALPAGWRRLVGLCAATALLMFGGAEALLRLSSYERPRWYPTAINALAGQPARYLFVGSSRVSAAIDVARFSANLETPRELTVNVGQGFSTVTAHALGLRRLSERGLLRGTTVFLEAPLDVPDSSTWRDPWYMVEAPHFLLSVIGPRDLLGFWRSTQSIEAKLAATGRMMLGPSWIATYHEHVRVEALAGAYSLAGLSAPVEPADRGVRRDVDDLSRIRASAADVARKASLAPVVSDWSTTVTGWIVDRVRQSGGRVVFYRMPMSSAMRVESDNTRANAHTFREQAAAWGLPLLDAGVVFGDADFPDLWHLSLEASVRFTDGLSAALKARQARQAAGGRP